MGGALLDGILSESVLAPEHISVVERNPERVGSLTDRGLTVVSTLSALDRDIDLLLIAVKPQIFQEVAVDIAKAVSSKTTLLSIMAGVSTSVIASLCQHEGPIVRSMPNLPVQIGKGMALYSSSGSVPDDHEQFLQHMFSATGKLIRVDEERLIDAGTAISGSGPAYIFYFIEHIKKAALDLGFSSEDADLLIGQTMEGALALWQQSDLNASELRIQVTSKGGTTEAALKTFESGEVGKTIQDGIRQAFHRAEELSGNN